MILLLDNYDSFVYNLERYAVELGFHCMVVRNDKITIDAILAMQPSHIILSPGPCSPNEAGVSLEVVKKCGIDIPIFGVCLGHQAIGQAFGGKVVAANQPMHGRASYIYHNHKGIFEQVENPLQVARYHSLIVEKESLPECLEILALSEQGEIMALRHKVYPIYGVQFHPESILTKHGRHLMKCFFESTIDAPIV